MPVAWHRRDRSRWHVQDPFRSFRGADGYKRFTWVSDSVSEARAVSCTRRSFHCMVASAARAQTFLRRPPRTGIVRIKS